jgi:hypothetical protein
MQLYAYNTQSHYANGACICITYHKMVLEYGIPSVGWRLLSHLLAVLANKITFPSHLVITTCGIVVNTIAL